MVGRFAFGSFLDDTLTTRFGVARMKTPKPSPKRISLSLPWSEYHPNNRYVRLDLERPNVKEYAAKIKQVL
jgi:hypothetical protein